MCKCQTNTFIKCSPLCDCPNCVFQNDHDCYHCWSGIILFYFDIIRVFLMRISHFFYYQYGVVIWGFFLNIYHLGLNIMQETFLPTWKCHSIYTINNYIDLNNNSGTWSFFHLRIPTKYHKLIGVTILIPTCSSLIPLLM